MSIVVVLQRPQDLVNIAGVVRAMKNFGMSDLRLVAPEEYDEYRIEGIAHNSYDLLERVRQFDDLDAALADCTFVVGMTARERTAKRNTRRPRDVVAELLGAAEDGCAAVVLGPEDRGLNNDELDRCHRTVTIPTDAAYPSLNLTQAFTVMAYELAIGAGSRSFKSPRRAAESATQEEIERIFTSAHDALSAIDFFKTRNPATIMRTVREVVHRTSLDQREAGLFRAMCIEVIRYLERHGVR